MSKWRSVFVYLMRNERNGFIKIGCSKSPAYREKTLQSEEPEVSLLFAYLGEPDLERGLHKLFASKRIRGEWFALSEEDIRTVDKILWVETHESRHEYECGYPTPEAAR